MVNKLLLLAYPAKDEVLTSFRWAPSYGPPDVYTGDATLTQVSSAINETHYSVIFRCEGCLQWTEGDVTGGAKTSTGQAIIAWAHAEGSPEDGECADTAAVALHETQGILPATFGEGIASEEYEAWAELATSVVPGTCA